MNKWMILPILMLLLAIQACNPFAKNEIWVDNTFSDTLSLHVGKKLFLIPGNTVSNIKLKEGVYAVQATIGEEEVFNETVSMLSDGILNVGGNSYVIYKELFLANQDNYDEIAQKVLKNTNVEVNGKTYENVDFTIIENENFISKDWDFGLLESFPEELESENGEYAVSKKIYSISALEKEWGFWGNHDFSEASDKELQQFLDSLALELDSLP
jgi:hypothetical protein